MTRPSHGKSSRRASTAKASDDGAKSDGGEAEMPAKEVKTIVELLFPGKWGRIAAAFVALALGSAAPIYGMVKSSKPAESKPIENAGGLPFKDNRLVMIVKGLDPHGKGCTKDQVSLSNPDSYGFETNGLTITKRTARGFEATFDSDRISGPWSATGRATGNELSAAFNLEGGGQGTVKLRKRPNQSFALGWQVAHDCVGDVELACPAAMGPDAIKDTWRNDPVISKHLGNNCHLLAMPEEKVIQP